MAPIIHSSPRSSSTTLIKRLLHTSDASAALSPMDVHDRLLARAAPAAADFEPSHSTVDPTAISNNGIFALFGLIGAGLVVTSIWFFFWARNGGFRFRKGDWAEYKSTVLRRKGPNGTTLSNATATTQLGGGSIVGSQGSMGADDVGPSVSEKGGPSVGRRARAAAHKIAPKKNRKHTKPSKDPEVRAYRHEKAAKVGGFNRAHDGWFHDASGTSRSGAPGADTDSAPSEAYGPGPWGRGAVPAAEPRTPRARQPSYQVGSEATFSVASDDSHRPLRASPQRPGEWSPASPAGTPRHSRQGSPTKRASGAPRSSGRYSGRASMPGSYAEPLDFESRYQESEGDESRGTKSYYHPIPGLGRSARGAAGAGGFRRGGGGRRDSLSDSEG